MLTAILFTTHAWAMVPVPASDAEGLITGATDDRFGFQITSGDLNADGRPDLVVSGSRDTVSGNRVYVFFGPIDLDAMPALDVSQADVVVEGFSGSETGWSIAVGDVVGSGDQDLLVSAPSLNGGRGRVFVYEGPLAASATLDTASDPYVTIRGFSSMDYVGWSVATGDWDDDGKDEVAVGAAGVSSQGGAVYLMDIDGAEPQSQVDTASAVVTFVGTPPNTTPGSLPLVGSLAGFAVSSAGDVDGDGIEDLLIGSPQARHAGLESAGKVHLYYGTSSPLATSYDLGAIPGTNAGIAAFGGANYGSNLGYALAPAGDLNQTATTTSSWEPRPGAAATARGPRRRLVAPTWCWGRPATSTSGAAPSLVSR